MTCTSTLTSSASCPTPRPAASASSSSSTSACGAWIEECLRSSGPSTRWFAGTPTSTWRSSAPTQSNTWSTSTGRWTTGSTPATSRTDFWSAGLWTRRRWCIRPGAASSWPGLCALMRRLVSHRQASRMSSELPDHSSWLGFRKTSSRSDRRTLAAPGAGGPRRCDVSRLSCHRRHPCLRVHPFARLDFSRAAGRGQSAGFQASDYQRPGAHSRDRAREAQGPRLPFLCARFHGWLKD